jgi:SAM-dependent methyltransferase
MAGRQTEHDGDAAARDRDRAPARGFLERVRDRLIDPSVRGVDPDSSAFAEANRRVLQRKPMLRRLFERVYGECREADERFFAGCPGRRVEIGSGSSFIGEVYPDVLTSDVKPLTFVDLVLHAEALPFRDRSLRAVYGINVLHHLPRPRAFFRELERALHPGGGAIFIEPFHGPVARWLFTRLHAAETFDAGAPEWEARGPIGPARGANQALSYIIFSRDRGRFEREFPTLELLVDRPHTHLLYLLSGGVSFRQLAPSGATSVIASLERALSPLDRWIALQHTLVLRRRA